MIWDLAYGFGLLFVIVLSLIFFTAVICWIFICIIVIFHIITGESKDLGNVNKNDEERAVSYFTRNSDNFYIKEKDGKWESFVLGGTIIRETKKEILDEIVILYLSKHKKYADNYSSMPSSLWEEYIMDP